MKKFIQTVFALIFMVLPSFSMADMYLNLGASQVIEIDQPFGRFVIGDPEVVDVTPITENSFYLLSKASGATSVQIFAANKTDLIKTLFVQSGPDLALLDRAIKRLSPDSEIDIYFENKSLQLIGEIKDEDSRALILQAAADISGATPIDGLRLVEPNQVRLKVRFLEVSRSLNGDIGAGLNLSGKSGKLSATASTFALADGALGKVSIISSAVNIDAVLKLLEEQGYAKFLAEPTLTALSGQEASFLAGGEVPITTADGSGATKTTYKQYGIQLGFKPVVERSGLITLTLSPEVSQVDFGNLSAGLPSFTTRRAATTVQMRNNQSIVLAGLYQSNDSRGKSAVPGFEKLPIIGPLFRTSSLRSSETEVLIVITPSLSTVSGADDLFERKMEKSEGAEPASFFYKGQIEKTGYDLRSLLAGEKIKGSYGPMISSTNKGKLNGQY